MSDELLDCYPDADVLARLLRRNTTSLSVFRGPSSRPIRLLPPSPDTLQLHMYVLQEARVVRAKSDPEERLRAWVTTHKHHLSQCSLWIPDQAFGNRP